MVIVKSFRKKTTRQWLTLLMLIFPLGCATTPLTQFYTLNGQARAPLRAQADQKPCAGKVIAVGPVQFPRYLDRPQIVSRVGPNKLIVNEFHRWGGSLEEDFLRVISINLATLLDHQQWVIYPSRDKYPIDFRIAFDIQQMDGRLGEGVILNARWTLWRQPQNKPVLIRQVRYREQANATGFEAFVSAMSSAVADLSRDISEALARQCSMHD